MRCRSVVQLWQEISATFVQMGQEMSEPSTFSLASLALGDRLETHLELVLLLVQNLNLCKQFCLSHLTSFKLVLALQVLGF